MGQRVLQLEDKTNITIEPEPCGSGGSGDVYKILSPSHLTNQVVKLYHKDRLTKEAENKISHLVSKKINQGDHESIVWIKNVVFENGKFAGFTMNYAEGVGLEKFFLDRWWQKTTGDWDKFRLENEKGIENRIRLCLNIAIAINIIHKNSKYTIADIKPSNFKIQKNGLVSIIDIDNIEVIENGRILYAAQVITPEYSPPEFHSGLDYKQTSASQNWDRYSLSILFYYILCGIHPFQYVKCKAPFEGSTDSEMICKGLFIFGNKASYLEPARVEHKNFLKLSTEIKSLFIQCFDSGHDKPQLRPSAEDWCRAFSLKKIDIKRNSITKLINEDATYSAKFKKALQFNTYSSSLILKGDNEILYPKPKFHDLSNSLTLFDKVMNFFKKSSKQILIDNLKWIEARITEAMQKQSTYRTEISNIISEFEGLQHEAKSNEKIQIEKLKKAFLLALTDVEYLAKEAHREEYTEVSEVQSQINSLIQKEDAALASYHSSVFGDLIKSFEKNRAEYISAIEKCEIDKKNEIDKQLKSENKLSQYNLEKECVKIFHGNLPSVISALRQLNFVTAADFSTVYSDGYLLNKFNKTIKIPGMGSERANKLHYWRTKIEQNENDKILNFVTSKYNKLKNEISFKWDSIEKNHRQTIEPLIFRFKNKEVEIKRNKNRLTETKETEINKIKRRFDKIQSDLKNEFILKLNKFYVDAENIFRQTKTVLLNNFSTYDLSLKNILMEIEGTNQWIERELKKYNSLYLRLVVK